MADAFHQSAQTNFALSPVCLGDLPSRNRGATTADAFHQPAQRFAQLAFKYDQLKDKSRDIDSKIDKLLAEIQELQAERNRNDVLLAEVEGQQRELMHSVFSGPDTSAALLEPVLDPDITITGATTIVKGPPRCNAPSKKRKLASALSGSEAQRHLERVFDGESD